VASKEKRRASRRIGTNTSRRIKRLEGPWEGERTGFDYLRVTLAGKIQGKGEKQL